MSCFGAVAWAAMFCAAASAQQDLSAVRFVGRWFPDGEGMRHAWGPGVFEVRFRGSTRVGVELVSNHDQELYHVCQVDGGAEVRSAHRSGLFTIATDLAADEEHTVRCGRSNEASYGETAVLGVRLDPGAELLPAAGGEHELRYEAIGDSITAGFAVTEPAGSPVGATLENCDVFQTYERHLADAWATSDWSVVARSGIAVTDYGGEVPMGERWPCRTFSWGPACPGEWDFGSWQADVVTINLGTNDYVFGSPSPEQFQAAYRDLIAQVRGKYPNALIACLAPLVYSCFGQIEKWQSAVASIEGAVRSFQQAGDDRVRYYTTGSPNAPWLVCSQDYSDYTHPTAEGNRKFAARLLQALTPDVRGLFPQKCGGTGTHCSPSGAGATPSPPTLAPTPAPTTPTSTTMPSQTTVGTPTPGPTPVPSPPPTPQPSPSPTGGCANTAYTQCGGTGFAGETCCPAGSWCKQVNEWWSMCQPCEHEWSESASCAPVVAPTTLAPTTLVPTTAAPTTPTPTTTPAPTTPAPTTAAPTTPAPATTPVPTTTPAPMTPAPATTPSLQPGSPCMKAARAQCGGLAFTGDACCPAGTWCWETNEWWSQCEPCEHKWDASCTTAAALISTHASGVARAAVRRHTFLAPVLLQGRVLTGQTRPAERKPGTEDLESQAAAPAPAEL